MIEARNGLVSGLSWSGASTIGVSLLGLSGLVVVARVLGPTQYAGFAVLWGTFFGIGGMFAGLQQEVTRSASQARPRGGSRLMVPALVIAVPVAAAGFGFVLGVDGDGVGITAALTLATGLVGLAGLTAISGVLTADARWAALACVLLIDATVRVAALTVVSLTHRPDLLPIAIVSGAFVWTAVLVFPVYRHAFVVRVPDWPGFVGRATLAMGSTACAALMVAGLPFLIAALRSEDLDADAGVALAALAIVRPLLLTVVYGFRPFVLRHFLGSRPAGITVWRVWGWCCPVAAAYVAVAWLLMPTGLELVLGPRFAVPGWMCAALAGGSVAIMLLVISGLALLAQDRHGAAGLGWLVALVGTITAIVLAGGAESSIVLAGGLGPWPGVVAHAYALRASRIGPSQSRPSENADSRSCRE